MVTPRVIRTMQHSMAVLLTRALFLSLVGSAMAQGNVATAGKQASTV